MKKYPNLKESSKLLNDYLNDGVKHSIVEVIQKAQEINPNIPAHIIGSSKPDTIAVELYCKIEDRSIRVPFEEKEFVEVKNTREDIVLKPVESKPPVWVIKSSKEEVKIGFWRKVWNKLKKMF